MYFIMTLLLHIIDYTISDNAQTRWKMSTAGVMVTDGRHGEWHPEHMLQIQPIL